MGDLPGDSVVITPEGNLNLNAECPASHNKLKELLAIPGLWGQVYAAMALSVAAFIAGIVEGWPGSMSLKLADPDTRELFKSEESGPIDNTELSLIYFYMLVSALVHMIITGTLMDRFGRKAGCWFLNFLAPFGWVVLATAQQMSHLYIGASLIGSVGVSGESVGVVYISEVSNDSIRGPLISLLMFFNSLGLFMAHVLGEELDFHTFHYICLVVTLSFPLFIWNLPESPQFLMLKSRVDEARESVAWYHGNDPIIIDSEMKKLKRAKKFDLVECKTLLGSLSNRKAILIVLSLSALTELAGTSLVEVFAGSTIAQINRSQFSAKIAAIVLASCRFIGGMLNVYFIERAGRKTTLTVSLLKMAVCQTFLWFFLSIIAENDSPPYPTKAASSNVEPIGLIANSNATHHIVTDIEGKVASYVATVSILFYILSMKITFYIATVCLVVYTLANQNFLGTTEVISGEILTAETKGAMMAFGGVARVVTLIICVLFYKHTLNVDTFGTLDVIFNAICCFLGAYVTHLFMPETRGKTLDEIHAELEKPTFQIRCEKTS